MSDDKMQIPSGFEMELRGGYPNKLERIVRVLRDAMVAIAALLISMLILTAINLVGDVSERLDNIDAPAPVTTECVGELC